MVKNQDNLEIIAPTSTEALRRVIIEQHDSLSRRMKQVAGLIIDSPEDVAFEKLAVIAERCGVQPSAVVRFAKAFGFTGAAEMQRLIRDELLATHINLGYGERARQFKEKNRNSHQSEAVLNEYVVADIHALEQLGTNLQAKEVDAAVQRIIAAKTVYIAGFRRAFGISSYLAYALQRSGKMCVFIDGSGGLWPHQLKASTPDDLLIAISYQPYAEETIGCVTHAKAQNTPILAITDSKVSPLAKAATQTLLVRDAEVRGFRSLTSSLCLAQILVVGYVFSAENDTNEA